MSNPFWRIQWWFKYRRIRQLERRADAARKTA